MNFSRQWEHKSWCTRKELESLIGSLHHVLKVVPPGHNFLWSIIDLLWAFQAPVHPIRLNMEFCLDLCWWLEFTQSWNGISLFCMPSICSLLELFIASNSSGAIGFSAIWNNVWFAGSWPFFAPSTNITALELFPLLWQLMLGAINGNGCRSSFSVTTMQSS